MRSARLSMFCAAVALVALAPSLAACAQGGGLLLGVGALQTTTSLISRAGVSTSASQPIL